MSRFFAVIFDSGVGGLTIYDEVRRMIPDAFYLYVSDPEFAPYGSKSFDEIEARTHEVLQPYIELRPDVVIIACNTASTVALPLLRHHFSCPIVGVVPAIKPAAQISKNKTIGGLATPWTVHSPYMDSLVADFASGVKVHRLGSLQLVQLAEAKMRGNKVGVDEVRPIIAPLFDRDESMPDVVVLGCTHFPILKQELEAAGPAGVQWVDSGKAIAARSYTFYHSDRPQRTGAFSKNLANTAVLPSGMRDPRLEECLEGWGFELQLAENFLSSF